ncbi:MAG: hypothetical protein GY811_24485 [Myxococcales bacterium]|nr:hypothetical protein [Myxococcales bacterium]
MAEVGGKLVSTAFELLAHLVDARELGAREEPISPVQAQLRTQLAGYTGRDENGRPTLALTLPSDKALDRIAMTLAKLVERAARRVENWRQ